MDEMKATPKKVCEVCAYEVPSIGHERWCVKTAKSTPTPWKIVEATEGEFAGNWHIVGMNGDDPTALATVWNSFQGDKKNAELIVTAVNERDSLLAENTRLRSSLVATTETLALCIGSMEIATSCRFGVLPSAIETLKQARAALAEKEGK